jgi:hypothetical protein
MEPPFEALFNEFRTLPPAVRRSPTFMEVAGYPHYENVCSNILAFYFDPSNPHGFGNLLLDTFAEAGSIDGIAEGAYANIAVERESTTNAGNRIDILIESDTLLIVIENKIFHAADNPFADYAAFINQRNVNGKTICKFVLTLEPSDAGSTSGFRNLTYPRLIDAVRQRLGHHTVHADTRYLVLLIELLNTLENLRVGSHMDPQFVGFLVERSNDVVALLEELDNFKKELRTKVTELGALIDLSNCPNVRQGFYRETRALFDDLVHDIHISDALPVRIDTVIRPQGWEISLWLFHGSDQERLRSLLRSLSIPFEEGEKLTYPTCFGYTEPLDRLQLVLQELIDKIAGAQ